MKKMLSWLDTHIWAFTLIIITIVCSLGFAYLQYRDSVEDREDDRLIQCLSEWANDITTRSTKLTLADQEKNIAEDKFIRALASLSSGSGDRQMAIDTLNKYVEKSDLYEQERKNNPVPKSPILRCK